MQRFGYSYMIDEGLFPLDHLSTILIKEGDYQIHATRPLQDVDTQAHTWHLMAPDLGSTAVWNASTAFSRGNRWVTSDLRSTRPLATSRIALGY